MSYKRFKPNAPSMPFNAGAVEVKQAGGTVIVQNPETARYPSMPLSLPPTIVDFEVDIERLGPLLYDLLTIGRVPDEQNGGVLHSILEHMQQQANLDVRHYKTATLLQHIGRRMITTDSRTMRDYLDHLKSHPPEEGMLVKALLSATTLFFHDPDAFAYLKSDILPELIARAHESDHVLRVWVPGCATGEEPYSLAMLITGLLGEQFSQWRIKIFATDIDEGAIAFARRGLYAENLLDGLPPAYVARFFERIDHGYRVVKVLRQMVVFAQHNLYPHAPFAHIDLVLCRNVLSHFTPEFQEQVLHRFAFSLFPGGYLFLGRAGTAHPPHMLYELVNKQWNVYRCMHAVLWARHAELPGQGTRFAEYAATRLARTAANQQFEQELPPPILEPDQLHDFNQMLFRFLPIGIVVIDRAYHVLIANGIAQRLLRLPTTNEEQDLLHAGQGIPLTTVRDAINTAFRDHNVVTLPEIELDARRGGNGSFISISIVPMHLNRATPDLAVISITDVTELVRTKRQLEATQAEQTQFMHELTAANKRLQDVHRALLAAHKELQARNEGMILTHEALQAAIEELEVRNEELQATNEELGVTNGDLSARVGELQAQNASLAGECKCLAEAVDLAPIYVMILRGPNLLVEACNQHWAELLHGKEAVGQRLETVFEFVETGPSLLNLAREVYQQERARTIASLPLHIPVATLDIPEQPQPSLRSVVKYFTCTLVPCHDTDGNISGVIMYATEEIEQQ